MREGPLHWERVKLKFEGEQVMLGCAHEQNMMKSGSSEFINNLGQSFYLFLSLLRPVRGKKKKKSDLNNYILSSRKNASRSRGWVQLPSSSSSRHASLYHMQSCLDKLSCSKGKSEPRGSERSCRSLWCPIALRQGSERKKQSKPQAGEAGQWRARKDHSLTIRKRRATCWALQGHLLGHRVLQTGNSIHLGNINMNHTKEHTC